MATSTKTIRVVVSSAPAVAGASAINNALRSIGTTTNGVTGRMTTNFGSVGQAINNVSGSLNAANNNARGLSGLFGSLGSSANAAMQRLGGLNGALGSIALSGAALGITATVGALGALAVAAVRASAEFEGYRASLTTVLGDTEKAGIAFDALTQFAQKTPFALDQSVQGFIKLKALGLQPTERAMTSYGNTSSAMGKSMEQMIEAVADASTGEFERLKEFGIKASKQGNDVAFTFQGVSTKVKNNSTEIQNYLMSIGETKFAGAMERQMATFAGAMSNLEDTWKTTLAAIGDGGLTSATGGFVNLLTDGLVTAKPLLVAVGNVLAGLVSGFTSIASGVGSAFGSIITAAPTGISMLEGLTFSLNLIGQGFQVIGTVAGAAMSAMGSVIGNVTAYATGAFGVALDAIGVGFDTGGRSWGNSLIGVLRTVKTVASLMPQIFSIAVNDTMRMFRDLGAAIGALLTGQWAKAKELASKTQFSNTGRAVNAVGRIGNATYEDRAGASSAINRMLGRTTKRDGSLDDVAGSAPAAAAAAAAANKDAAAKAKAEADFWATLKAELDTARLFGIEAAKFTKERELHKVLGREITAGEKSRVDAMVQSIANEKAVTSLKQSTFELENRATILRGRSLGLTEDQLKIEEALDAQRLTALSNGANTNSKDYQTWLAKYRAILESTAAIEKQTSLLKSAMDLARSNNALLDSGYQAKAIQDQRDAFLAAYSTGQLKDAWGNPMSEATRAGVLSGLDKALEEAKNKPFQVAIDFAKTAMAENGTTAQRRSLAQAEYDKTIAMLREGRNAGKVSAELFEVGSRKAGLDLQKRFREIGDDFAQRLRTVSDLFAQIGNLIGGKVGAAMDKASGAMDSIGNFANNKDGISKSITDAFGRNSPAVAGIGKAVGGAVAGLEIGKSIADLGKVFGANKGFQTGSKIGGTVGGLTGNPLIAAAASVVGGLIGSLFYKSKSGSAVITGGGASSIGLSGNNSARKKEANDLAGAVQGTLANYAAKLGGSIGAFQGITIGKYDSSYHVNTTGAATLKKGKAGVIDFNEDKDAAIEYAIKLALSRGAIQGLSDIAQKAVNTLDMDSAISFVQDWNNVMDDFKSMTDPVTSAVEAIIKPLKILEASMQTVGASSTDLAKLEAYRSMKLKDALKNQLSSLTDFIDGLKGENSGKTDLARLTDNLSKFGELSAKIANGDSSIDQAAFSKLGNEIAALSTTLYGGSTSMTEDYRSLLLGSAEKLRDNITSAFNAAAGVNVAATQISYDAMVSEQKANNDIARQQLELQQQQVAATIALAEALQSSGFNFNGLSGMNLV